MKTSIAFLVMVMLVSSISIASETEPVFFENQISERTLKTSPLCLAIVKGDMEGVKKLIELGSDVNEKSNDMSPLMYAARFNRVEMIKLLVTKGAKINARNSKGRTAKDFAKISGAQDAIKALEELKN